MEYKVSIIVPIYKSEKNIRRCIESIINQTYSNIEIILVDDGSPDKSIDICKEYSSRDTRIKVIQKQNGGVSSARNIGIKNAKGDLICFVDSDDEIDCSMIKYFIEKYNEGLYDFIFSNYTSIVSKGSEVETHNLLVKEFNGEITDFLNVFEEYSVNNNLLNTPWGKLYRRDIIEKNKIKFPEDISVGEDKIFVLHYLNYCKKISCIPKCLYKYYVYSKSTLSSKPVYSDIDINIRYDAAEYKYNLFRINDIIIDKEKEYSRQLFETIILNLLNNINYTSNQSLSKKIESLNVIVHNKIIQQECKKYRGYDLQTLIISKCIKFKFTYAILVYFNFKQFLYKKLNKLYKIVKEYFKR